ncbi:MAG: hypothetical protein HY652_07250 [Acidobacteria bacterium]|nr:hypothetical protein [Acidobacteriota bacterium]
MLLRRPFKVVVWGCLVLALLCGPAGARSVELKFQGMITAIDQESASVGTFSIHAFDFQVKVVVNAETEINGSNGDTWKLSDLSVGQFVQVSGYFSSKGLVAKEIQVRHDPRTDFEFRGFIENLTNSGTTLTIHGVAVLLDASTRIEGEGSDSPVAVSSLVVGQPILVKGFVKTLTGNAKQFIASKVKVGRPDRNRLKVEFEGTIKSINGDRNILQISVRGSDAPAEVLLTSETRIKGTLAVGAFVEVHGFLNSQLQVVATEIKVGDHDADDDKREPSTHTLKREIELRPTSVEPKAEGKAQFEFKSANEQKFQVEVEDLTPAAVYKVLVDGKELGSFTTDHRGKAGVTFRTSPGPDDRALPNTLRPVTAIKTVQVVNGSGATVLQGSF